IVVMLFFIASFIVANPGTVNAVEQAKDQCFVVSLNGNISPQSAAKMDQVITITPQYMNVPVGSCVVWVNWVRGPEISTSFKEGKTCAATTKSAVGYSITPETGCFITDFLPEGATSSLRFMEAGDYKYDIYVKGRKAPLASGKITVK
ncbi:MAG: hypothetical protein KKA35_13655, partial [Proteobacteria bacterium]|nr:hypothetical protein [Pseudomonadota bacterium]